MMAAEEHFDHQANIAVDVSGLEAAMAIEDRNQMLTANDPNFAEGVAAFFEKRKPNYT